MKTKLRFVKSLLVMAALCLGSNAWADNINATLDHTASSSRNKENAITTTVDQEFEHYNNTKAAAWGGWAYAQFSFTIPTGHSIESATLTWNTKIGGNSGTRNNDVYYVNAGTTIDYEGLTSTTNLNVGEITFIKNETVAGPTTRTQVETDVTDAVRALATQGYIIFKWTNNAAGADLYGKGSADYKPTLVIVTTNEVLYTATFNETNSLTPSVTIYSDSERSSVIANGMLSANTKYYYTATLNGYENFNGSFDVAEENPTINFTMTSLPRYTFTVNAVNSVGGAVIKTLYTDADSYDGKEHSLYFSKYLTGDGNIVTYSKDDNTYYQNFVSVSGDATKTVSYTAYNGVAYFFEGESFDALGTKVENGNYSSGWAGRSLNGTVNIMTIPVAGTYNLSYAICSNNVGTGKETTYNFFKNNSENVIESVTDLNHSVNQVKTTGTRSVNDITFTNGDVLQFNSTDGKIILDYVLIECVSVSKTISAAGWATYCSPYALDLTGAIANLNDAFIVTGGAAGVLTKTSVMGATVPANTGLLLKGKGDCTIPVVASGTADVAANKLVGVTSNTEIAANAGYVLMGTPSLGFYQNSNAFTVGANTAYLPADFAGAGARTFFQLDAETTGINAIENAETVNGIYNLAGQRVAQPTRGLYIVNGKKIVVK